jgi:hypothetical protein
MTLKLSLAGAVACMALPSFAQAADMQPVLKSPGAQPDQQASGYVEVYSGWASTRAENGGGQFRFNGWALGGAGRGNYWVSRDMSVQVDAQAEGTSYDNSGGGRFSTHSYLVGGHWSWRNPQQYLFGLFGGVGDAGGDGQFTFSGSQRHGLIGAEAQWYWQQFTLYAQAGYDSMLGTVGGSVDGFNAWFIRGTGRYFVNPNFLIEGTAMYANGNVDFNFGNPSVRFQTWTWEVKSEWRFATAPFSVFTKYQGSETTYDDLNFTNLFNAKTTDHRVLFGLKLHMGDRTLQQTDRAGATLDIISPLANPTNPLMLGPAIAPSPPPPPPPG